MWLRVTKTLFLLMVTMIMLIPSRASGIELHCLFSDNMVIQRDSYAPVWGWANPGEYIILTFSNQIVTAIAGNDGAWGLKLAPMEAGGPFTMLIRGKKDTLSLKNVMVGDVWLCSGQSNMDWHFYQPVSNGLPKENRPNMRLFKLGPNGSYNQRILNTRKENLWPPHYQRVPTEWKIATPGVSKYFSQTAYSFGLSVHDSTEIPIGLLLVAVGGSQIKSWMSPRAYDSLKDTCITSTITTNRYAAKMDATWYEHYHHSASVYYNGMIHQLTSFALKGIIWWQGESDASVGNTNTYEMYLRTLIRDWRKSWKNETLPFYYVQLQTYDEGGDLHLVRDSQFRTLSEPHTGMSVIADSCIGLHPTHHDIAGRRLALIALNRLYDRNIAYSGPLYKNKIIEGNSIRIEFDYVSDGLLSRNGRPLTNASDTIPAFEIAPDDSNFVAADAIIDGSTVVVSSPDIQNPEHVRYAYHPTPSMPLYNSHHLPASPFTTVPFSARKSALIGRYIRNSPTKKDQKYALRPMCPMEIYMLNGRKISPTHNRIRTNGLYVIKTQKGITIQLIFSPTTKHYHP